MENGANFFANGNRGHNSNNASVVWDIRQLHSSRSGWVHSGATSLYTHPVPPRTEEATLTTHYEASTDHAPMFYHRSGDINSQHHYSLYAGDGSRLHPDPHLMCLKLGKRHYFEDATPLPDRHVATCSLGKRGKPHYGLAGEGGIGAYGLGPSSSSSATSVPRCQVEGCHVALVNAKDYHKRHKVCEMHSKAPRVVVLGLEQRFCQQCSRFHVVSEFDEAKRSCRRRLAGHNERRRKSSHDSVARNSSQNIKLMTERFSRIASTPTGRALSLLSSKANSWESPSDLSSRSSAALRELITENRAALLSRQLMLDRESLLHHPSPDQDLDDSQTSINAAVIAHNPYSSVFHTEPHGWDRAFQESAAHVTLNLMKPQGSAFGVLSLRDKTKQEDCSDLWSSLEGSHVV